MFKKISIFFVAVMLAGCSSISDMTSYIPFMGKDKKVIDLDKDKSTKNLMPPLMKPLWQPIKIV